MVKSATKHAPQSNPDDSRTESSCLLRNYCGNLGRAAQSYMTGSLAPKP